MTDLAPFTISYSARCGKILGIGHPAGGEDAYELTIAADPAGGEDEVVVLKAPRVFEDYKHFVVGAYYCQPLNAEGDIVEPIAILPPAFFTKAATAAPIARRQGEAPAHGQGSKPGPAPAASTVKR